MSPGETLQVLAAGLYLAIQVFNMIGLRWRIIVSMSAVSLSIATIALEPSSWEAALAAWLFANLLLVGKWFGEVKYDVADREESGKALLVRDVWNLNLFLNPGYTLLYRRRMFRDRRSRKRFLKDSVQIPDFLTK